MPKTTAKKAAPKQSEPLLPCRILINGTLYNGAHHAKNKQMPIPKSDADALAEQGAVEILPGLA